MSTTLELVTRTEWWTGSTGPALWHGPPVMRHYIVHRMRWRAGRGRQRVWAAAAPRRGGLSSSAAVTPPCGSIWTGLHRRCTVSLSASSRSADLLHPTTGRPLNGARLIQLVVGATSETVEGGAHLYQFCPSHHFSPARATPAPWSQFIPIAAMAAEASSGVPSWHPSRSVCLLWSSLSLLPSLPHRQRRRAQGCCSTLEPPPTSAGSTVGEGDPGGAATGRACPASPRR